MAQKKPTMKEMEERVIKLGTLLNQTSMALHLFTKFLKKDVEFKKYLIDWNEEQSEMKDLAKKEFAKKQKEDAK